MKRILFFVCIAVLSLNAFATPSFSINPGESNETPHAQPLTKISDVKTLCDMFMAKLTDDDARGAFTILRPYSSVALGDFENYVSQASRVIESVRPDYGKIIGYQMIQEKNVHNAVLRYTYLLKFEKHALRWMFYFYNSDDEWLFNEFNVDNKLKELF
jgi:hypothetical protein